MIKLTQHGNHPSYSGSCLKCGCQVTCGQEDVYHDNQTTNNQMYVICPECGEKIIITSGYFPVGCNTAISVGQPKVEIPFNWSRPLKDYADMVGTAIRECGYSHNTYIYNVLTDLQDDLLILAQKEDENKTTTTITTRG